MNYIWLIVESFGNRSKNEEVKYEFSCNEISQRKLGTKYIFSIKMDSVEYKSMENTQAQVFSNMKLYVTDPWFAASDCVVKHISYEFYDHLGGGTLLGNFTAYTKDLKH